MLNTLIGEGQQESQQQPSSAQPVQQMDNIQQMQFRQQARPTFRGPGPMGQRSMGPPHGSAQRFQSGPPRMPGPRMEPPGMFQPRHVRPQTGPMPKPQPPLIPGKKIIFIYNLISQRYKKSKFLICTVSFRMIFYCSMHLNDETIKKNKVK